MKKSHRTPAAPKPAKPYMMTILDPGPDKAGLIETMLTINSRHDPETPPWTLRQALEFAEGGCRSQVPRDQFAEILEILATGATIKIHEVES